MTKPTTVTALIDEYLSIKNALVSDDQQTAATVGNKLIETAKAIDFNSFPEAQRNEIRDILEVISEHREHISKSEIERS